MGLFLKFGNYTHAEGEAAVRIGGGVQFDRANRPVTRTVTWDIAARAEGDDRGDLLTALARVARAYDARNQRVTARLVDDAGRVCHELSGPASLGGIRIEQPPSFPDGTGAELTTYRNYTVRLAADYVIGNPARLIVSFSETLTFEGGGPDRGLIVVANGPPVPYLSAKSTPYRCTQTGSAVGFADYPTWLIRPAFPLALHEGPALPVAYTGPEANGAANVNFGVSWQYRFASGTPLRALPRPFPRT